MFVLPCDENKHTYIRIILPSLKLKSANCMYTVQRTVNARNGSSDATTDSVLKNMHSVFETRSDHCTDVRTEA